MSTDPGPRPDCESFRAEAKATNGLAPRRIANGPPLRLLNHLCPAKAYGTIGKSPDGRARMQRATPHAPPLDLLDRGLVTGLRLSPPGDSGERGTSGRDEAATTETVQQHDPFPAFDGIEGDIGQTRDAATAPTGRASSRTYYVRSAQQQQSSRNTTSRFRNAAYEQTTYYEVRLNAWSCSCPAFTFSAFPATLSDDHDRIQNHSHSDMSYGGKESPSWNFGGLSQGTDMPVCKHLLACTFVEHSSMFADMVEERTVSMEEMAGWAAGWGD
ncbi:hypothetical protein LTR91_025039 [Friedmanniomyces endolithicus]|uniref:SWIM-type domain-containing protein n=1 Tax=Friedmanniomyces endolithicus TaxID=329885 RepID=A0AAN6H5V3_9PEZI|nr:hypothetical protein LTR94_022516 [Friedmanniomyces endolithicus]KAK0768573.1 hypothetical protein LTR59_017567 [Friedmanniomyces endolithicus]KAK0772572.1 hypothetical protein LTR75_017375 [Friedmanniomyces endolithicus]KAK0796660.1 hypothetical protein LTR38_008495 [Friedmanniomyces endolithicus]KAK0837171.1 hypothetical protein LTR03_013014 [Friedmanniomyces endolithicus]